LSATYFSIKVPFTEISIGRFIKKLLHDTFTDVQVSQFVERWTSMNTSGEFKIWGTDKILDAYNSANYDKMIIDMNFNKYEPSVLDSMYEKKYNKSYILNNPVNIETVLYITEYKFLQITQNNINLRYSN
jgi:hypothetical protein